MYLLQHLLARSAAAAPGATAMDTGGATLSYSELDARSGQLARRLVELGAGRGVPVGLAAAKGPLALVGIFAILRSGSCYVPLDPAGSAFRARQVLDDAAIGIVVLDEHSRPALDAAADGAAVAPVRVVLDAASTWATAGGPLPGELPTDQPPMEQPPTDEDPAYILYTSGSTGAPKGVTLSHRAAMAFVRHCLDTFGIEPGDRVSSHAPLHFDLSILDVFVTIAAGAAIVPVTGDALVFPRTLAELIDEQRISVWYSVPFALTQLAAHGGLERFGFERLRTVLFAGEPMSVGPLRELMTRWPRARFFNLYGPTETNVVTWYEASRDATQRLGALPIGTPWPNSEVQVVDGGLRPVAPGRTGELCVRGRTAMTGYWRAPDATARAFVPLPVHPDLPPREFYRTGDLVRADEDGLLWFVGRRDDMVKIRGHRVEPAEVEAVLARHPALAQVAVVAVAHQDLGIELVAAVTPVDAATPPDPHDVLAFCAAHLPRYLLPGRVELLTELPRTSTGKLDRRQLTRDLTAPAGVQPALTDIHS